MWTPALGAELVKPDSLSGNHPVPTLTYRRLVGHGTVRPCIRFASLTLRRWRQVEGQKNRSTAPQIQSRITQSSRKLYARVGWKLRPNDLNCSLV